MRSTGSTRIISTGKTCKALVVSILVPQERLWVDDLPASAPPAGCVCWHDHGSNYLADDFQQEIAFFGIESSPSFVREPEGNGVAERFIRTLKENLLWVRSFETIEELRLALLAFKRTYNEQWMLEKYDYRSPARVRRDLVGLDAAA